MDRGKKGYLISLVMAAFTVAFTVMGVAAQTNRPLSDWTFQSSVLGGMSSFTVPSYGLNSSSNGAEILGFVIEFVGKEYDAETDLSTWTYRVNPTINADKDLSHWGISLCIPHRTDPHTPRLHYVARQGGSGSYMTSHPRLTEVGTDPHSQISGIKFDVEVDKYGHPVEFWFTLEGDWEIGDREIHGKAGPPTEKSRYIPGPSCEPVVCTIHFDITHGRQDFRVMRPGTYASALSIIRLSGTSGATLTFDAFEDAIYLTDNTQPAIESRFAFGDTLPSAAQDGWMTATELNEYSMYFDKESLKGGMELILWTLVNVNEYNYSSDYEASGEVRITPDCK